MPAATSARRGGARSAPSFGLKTAAHLAEATYTALTHPLTRGHVKAVKHGKTDHVQGYLLRDGTLLVPGSNSAADYLLYNVRLLNIGGSFYSVKSRTTKQKLGASWHQGFLAHAMALDTAFRSFQPRFLIGHSLGAASVQFLSLLWGVPAIGFAAPRLYAGGQSVPGQRLSLSLVRRDDPVWNLPPGFKHTGRAYTLDPNRRGGFKHKMKHYIADLDRPDIAAALPSRWPS